MIQYRHVVLGLLTLTYMVNFIDRQIIMILIEPIRNDLELSDQQLGLLSGTVFALFYTTLGVPIARLADKTVRKNIISVSLGLWSTLTFFSGLTTNYIQLLFARMGVGASMSGLTPAAHSLISEYFDERHRTFAISVYTTGPSIGMFVAFIFGGVIADQYGWRTAFIAAGLPGIILSFILWFAIKEPKRVAPTDDTEHFIPENGSLMSVLRYLWSLPAWRYILIGLSLIGISLFGPVISWTPSFLIREYGLSTTEAGAIIGPIAGIVGGISVLVGGYLSDLMARRGSHWLLRIPAISYTCCFFVFLATYTTGSLSVMIVLLCLLFMFLNLATSAYFSAAQSLAPPTMRAVSTATVLLAIGLIGFGFGPQFVGIISDLLTPRFGEASLGYAMMCTSPLILAGAFCLYLGSRSINADLKRSANLGVSPSANVVVDQPIM